MKFRVFLVIALIISTGCSAPLGNFASGTEKINNISCIAVLPFENLSGYGSAGQIVSDIVSMKLMKTGDFSVMTTAEVEDMLEARRILFKNGIPPSEAASIGNILGVQAVFSGIVTSYPSEAGPSGNGSKTAGFKLYFIDVSSGNVLWTGAGDFRSASAPDGQTIPCTTVVQDGVIRLIDQFNSGVNNSAGFSDAVCWNDPNEILAKLVIERHAAETAPPAVPAPAAAGTQVAGIPPANISIINASGVPKLEIKMGILFVQNKFNVSNVISGKKRINRTTIFYKQKYYNQALEISKLLKVQPELVQSDSYNWDITVFIGRDMK